MFETSSFRAATLAAIRNTTTGITNNLVGLPNYPRYTRQRLVSTQGEAPEHLAEHAKHLSEDWQLAENEKHPGKLVTQLLNRSPL